MPKLTTKIPRYKTLTQGAQALACPGCDLLYRGAGDGDNVTAVCGRCGFVLRRGRGLDLAATGALVLTALTLLVLANVYPLLTLELQGQAETVTVISAAGALVKADMNVLGILVGFTTVAIPALEIAALLYVIFPLLVGQRAPGASRVFATLEHLRPWGMVEVYLLGVLVAIFKLSSLASVEVGIALFAFAGFVVVAMFAVVTIDAEAIWQKLDVT